ncbi:hypothetical protein SMMN14_01923 [Sphaerulina musiva]
MRLLFFLLSAFWCCLSQGKQVPAQCLCIAAIPVKFANTATVAVCGGHYGSQYVKTSNKTGDSRCEDPNDPLATTFGQWITETFGEWCVSAGAIGSQCCDRGESTNADGCSLYGPPDPPM